MGGIRTLIKPTKRLRIPINEFELITCFDWLSANFDSFKIFMYNALFSSLSFFSLVFLFFTEDNLQKLKSFESLFGPHFSICNILYVLISLCCAELLK